MYNYGKHTGYENGVEWCIDDGMIDPVEISVKSKKTNQSESVTYRCMHQPIFGYDVDDIYEINKILNGLIKKYGDKKECVEPV